MPLRLTGLGSNQEADDWQSQKVDREADEYRFKAEELHEAMREILTTENQQHTGQQNE